MATQMTTEQALSLIKSAVAQGLLSPEMAVILDNTWTDSFFEPMTGAVTLIAYPQPLPDTDFVKYDPLASLDLKRRLVIRRMRWAEVINDCEDAARAMISMLKSLTVRMENIPLFREYLTRVEEEVGDPRRWAEESMKEVTAFWKLAMDRVEAYDEVLMQPTLEQNAHFHGASSSVWQSVDRLPEEIRVMIIKYLAPPDLRLSCIDDLDTLAQNVVDSDTDLWKTFRNTLIENTVLRLEWRDPWMLSWEELGKHSRKQEAAVKNHGRLVSWWPKASDQDKPFDLERLRYCATKRPWSPRFENMQILMPDYMFQKVRKVSLDLIQLLHYGEETMKQIPQLLRGLKPLSSLRSVRLIANLDDIKNDLCCIYSEKIVEILERFQSCQPLVERVASQQHLKNPVVVLKVWSDGPYTTLSELFFQRQARHERLDVINRWDKLRKAADWEPREKIVVDAEVDSQDMEVDNFHFS